MAISMTVRNGTVVGQESLCRTCRHAHIQLGYPESEEEIHCGYFYELPRLVPFAVNQCSDYPASSCRLSTRWRRWLSSPT